MPGELVVLGSSEGTLVPCLLVSANTVSLCAVRERESKRGLCLFLLVVELLSCVLGKMCCL